jgi:hypothetical protein
VIAEKPMTGTGIRLVVDGRITSQKKAQGVNELTRPRTDVMNVTVNNTVQRNDN